MPIFHSPFKNPVIRDAVFLVVLTFLLLVPFINKPFSLDSGANVVVARHILESPLRPFDFTSNTAGKLVREWDYSNNPPAACYLIAGTMALFGEKEAPLHAVYFFLAAIAVLALYFIARELEINALFTALLLIASPAFLVNATDIMLDIPLLAFSLAGVLSVLRGERNNSPAALVAGWILMGIAVLTKYTAVLLIVPLLSWLYINKKPLAHYLYAMIPVFFVAVWCAHNYLIFGEMQLFGRTGDVGFHLGIAKAISLITYIGGALIFPLSIIAVSVKSGKRQAVTAIVLIVAGDLLFNVLDFSPHVSLLAAVLLAAGIMLFALMIHSLTRERFEKRTVFLAIWLLVNVLFFAVTSALIAVRYLILLLPAAILLFVHFSEKYRKMLAATAVAGIVVSLAVAQSDYTWASSYRNMASYLSQAYGRNMYFTGSFAFKYYMEKAGATPVESDKADYPVGAVIVTTVISGPQPLHPALLCRMALKDAMFVTGNNPLRTISPECQAGFHLNMYGLLPFSFSDKPLEKFSIFIIKT